MVRACHVVCLGCVLFSECLVWTTCPLGPQVFHTLNTRFPTHILVLKYLL